MPNFGVSQPFSFQDEGWGAGCLLAMEKLGVELVQGTAA